MTKIDKLWYCQCGNEEFVAKEDYSNYPLTVNIRKTRGKVRGAVHWSEFEERFMSAHDLAVAVWDDFAFCALFGESRKHVDFIGAYHMCLDFDENHGYTLATICENEFVMRYASFAHTTTSHTDAKPRLRVVFLFDKIVTTIEDYQSIAAGMAERFPSCETASIGQAGKPWSGAHRCEVKGVWSYIHPRIMEALRKRGKELRKKPEPVRSEFVRIGGGGNYDRYVDACFENAKRELSQCKPTDTNRRFYDASVKLFNIAAARWNETSSDDVMSFLESETGGFWGGRHRDTAESAMSKGMMQEAREPEGRRSYKVGIGEVI